MPGTTSGPRRSAAPPPESPTGAAARLGRYLGDPEDPTTMLSHARAAAADEHEAFPAEACGLLDLWGLPDHYVPAEYGGLLTDYGQLSSLVRTLAGRDLTAAVAHFGTFLGSACVWASGDDAAARRLAGQVRAGHAVALGLTERHHDGDPLSTEITAWPVARGFLLNGEKNLVPGAARARLVCLLARTGADAGPRAYSILLVDKRSLSGCWEELDRVPTHGIRGAGIGGLAFTDAVCPADSLVGAPGQGGEIVLKGLQLTRAVSPALSLGAADQALRLAVSAVRERRGYGGPLAEVPFVRRVLGECAADLLAAEALSAVTARTVHLLPQELSVTSAAAAYLVPEIVTDVFGRLGALFTGRVGQVGAQARERFLRAERDHRTVRSFGGSATAHLYALSCQFRHLARPLPDGPDGLPGPAAYDPEAALPVPRPQGLALVSRGGSSLLAELPVLARELGRAAGSGSPLAGAARAADDFAGHTRRLLATLPPAAHTLTRVPADYAELARQVALCLTASACLGTWRHARGVDALWPHGQWLEPVLRRLWQRLGPMGAAAPPTGPESCGEGFDALSDRVTELSRSGAPCTLVPLSSMEGAA